MKRIHWILIIGASLVIALLAGKAMKGGAPTDVFTDRVQLRSIVETVSATGKIQPETEVKISSDVSGEITEMRVKEGDQVKKGDLLCRIRPDLYLSAFDRVSAAVNTSRANLSTTRAQLEQAQANLANAEALYRRNQKLFESSAISLQEFEAAKAQFEAAKANVQAMEANVSASMYTIRSSEASLKEASANLEKTFIYAPVDGTVSKMSVEKGERVVGVTGMQGTEILRLANLNEMEVSVDVNENDIIKVHKNDTAIIEVDAYMGKKFKGLVTEIANSANTNGISVDQVTNFTVKVRMLRESYAWLITERNPVPFRPGMSAGVDIQTTRAENVLSVPIQAVTTRSADSLSLQSRMPENEDATAEAESARKPELSKTREVVFVVSEGRVREREVKTGIQDNEFIEISAGLKNGEEVICGPYRAVSRSLREGSAVRIVKKEELYSNLN